MDCVNTKYDLYARLEKRAFDYPKALGPSGDSSWYHTIVSHWNYFKQKLESLDAQYNLFGKGFWGYGINRICDGKATFESLDVMEVDQLNQQNKHHAHGIIHLMIFKVEAQDFIYHTFSFNLLNLQWISNLSQKMRIDSITNVKTRINNQQYFVEIESSALPLTMSFQVETYYSHNTAPETISSYYVREITRLSIKERTGEVNPVEDIPSRIAKFQTLKDSSCGHELSFFMDENNIPNQDLVAETISYFKSGPGARVFTSLEFLNLFEKQYQFVKMNFNEGEKVIEELNHLPLTDLEKHVLFGFLLKWFGGYPIHNFNEDLNATLNLIEVFFLNYPELTPEKDFCKANKNVRKKMMKMGIIFTTAINTGIDANKLIEGIEEEEEGDEIYHSFDLLFEAAANNGALGDFKDKLDYFRRRTKIHFDFNVWLLEEKQWRYGNDEAYNRFLTKAIFIEFMQYQADKEREQLAQKQTAKSSWLVNEPLPESTLGPQARNMRVSIKSSVQQSLLEILKDFFEPDQQPMLRLLLESGCMSGQKLIFLDSGNRLADAFKKLITADLIPGCSKKELQNWLGSNFSYKSSQGIKSFTSDYLEKCISRNDKLCKRPLLHISNGNVVSGPEPLAKINRNF